MENSFSNSKKVRNQNPFRSEKSASIFFKKFRTQVTWVIEWNKLYFSNTEINQLFPTPICWVSMVKFQIKSQPNLVPLIRGLYKAISPLGRWLMCTRWRVQMICQWKYSQRYVKIIRTLLHMEMIIQ